MLRHSILSSLVLARRSPVSSASSSSNISSAVAAVALRFAASSNSSSGKKPAFVGGAGAVLSAKKPSSSSTATASSATAASASGAKKEGDAAGKPSPASFDPDRVRALQAQEQEAQRERETRAMLQKQHDDKLRAERQKVLDEEQAARDKEDAARKYRESQKQAAEQSVESIIGRFKAMRKKMTVKELVLIHGPFFGTWYVMLTTCYTVMLTLLLHWKVVPFFESSELAERFGVKERFDTIGNKSKQIGPITLSGRFFANYIVVSAVLAPLIPLKVSAALATYPIALRMLPRWVTQKRAAAAEKLMSKTASAAAAARG
jgi:hypothetical protein